MEGARGLELRERCHENPDAFLFCGFLHIGRDGPTVADDDAIDGGQRTDCDGIDVILDGDESRILRCIRHDITEHIGRIACTDYGVFGLNNDLGIASGSEVERRHGVCEGGFVEGEDSERLKRHRMVVPWPITDWISN